MSNNKSNHVCKYSGCRYGENDTPKHYYACADCDKYNSWKSMGCCFEHFMCYQNEVAMARDKDIPFPELLDVMVADGVISSKEPEIEIDVIDIESQSAKSKRKR